MPLGKKQGSATDGTGENTSAVPRSDSREESGVGKRAAQAKKARRATDKAADAGGNGGE